jgi:hypothetical protein
VQGGSGTASGIPLLSSLHAERVIAPAMTKNRNIELMFVCSIEQTKDHDRVTRL